MDKLSDIGLNKAIADIVHCCGGVEVTENGTVYVATSSINPYVVDYCNNWNDLMPFVEKYNICYYIHNSKWFVSCELYNIYVEGTDLKSTLAECLLKVLQEIHSD